MMSTRYREKDHVLCSAVQVRPSLQQQVRFCELYLGNGAYQA